LFQRSAIPCQLGMRAWLTTRIIIVDGMSMHLTHRDQDTLRGGTSSMITSLSSRGRNCKFGEHSKPVIGDFPPLIGICIYMILRMVPRLC
jgi:hypothetical protein